MKILVVCQHYWPEPYPLPDICEEFVRRGHTVDVITDTPNYPMGEIYPEYQKGKRRKETHNGVNIIRTFTIPRKHNVLFRVLNYYSYALSSSIHANRIKEDYDVVFANQTSPVMMASAAFVYAKKHKKKVVLYCMDLWPACLAAGNICEGSPIYSFFGHQARKIYNRADRILITSQMFREYLTEQHGVNTNKIDYLPQYAATGFEEVAIEKNIEKQKETIDLMFAGNIGLAQSIPTIIGAAEILKDIPNLRWHIIGEGSELENMKSLAGKKNLRQIIFHGRKPAREMPKYYAMADAMIVTLTSDPFISLTLPGKVQSYMAAGKPILAAACGEIPRIIAAAECGYCAGAEDSSGLADVVKCFLHNSERKQLGNNAREYYNHHFARKQFMDSLENSLRAIQD